MIRAELRDVASRVLARHAPLAALGAAAAGVVVVDELTKFLALQLLSELDVTPARIVQLGIVHNADFAWGLSAGGDISLISTVVVLFIAGLSIAVCGALAGYDRSAPVMLGLIVGAGVANATDGLAAPAGVVDWIAIGATDGIVMNLADVAVLVGVGLCARTAWRLARAIRDPSRIRP